MWNEKSDGKGFGKNIEPALQVKQFGPCYEKKKWYSMKEDD